MLFIEVEELPKIDRRAVRDHKDMFKYLKEFMDMNAKIVWVVYEQHEYTDTQSARATIKRACRRYEFPIEVYVRNHDLYLVRTDI